MDRTENKQALSTSFGPLTGVKVVEVGGVGPAPHCGMMLADMGAEVIRIERAADLNADIQSDLIFFNRNKRSVALDLKSSVGIVTLKRLINQAEIVIEGFRPGVMENLGLGPEVFADTNPELIYGRMTGWGQDGPISQAAGHDLNYIAITGALYAMGYKDQKPAIPLNLVGDFGGGSLYFAMGLLAARIQAMESGRGQIVDCAITDGVNNLLTMQHGMIQSGDWDLKREANLVDGGAPFYCVYETKDGKYVSIAPVEPKFYQILLKLLDLDKESLPRQYDKVNWHLLRQRFTEVFLTKTREQWCTLLEGTDACFAPVLDFEEAREYAHNLQRNTMIDAFGLHHPKPAPCFSRTPSTLRNPAPKAGQNSREVLQDWGFSVEEIFQIQR